MYIVYRAGFDSPNVPGLTVAAAPRHEELPPPAEVGGGGGGLGGGKDNRIGLENLTLKFSFNYV